MRFTKDKDGNVVGIWFNNNNKFHKKCEELYTLLDIVVKDRALSPRMRKDVTCISMFFRMASSEHEFSSAFVTACEYSIRSLISRSKELDRLAIKHKRCLFVAIGCFDDFLTSYNNQKDYGIVSEL